jgi:hypothetical protein
MVDVDAAHAVVLARGHVDPVPSGPAPRGDRTTAWSVLCWCLLVVVGAVLVLVANAGTPSATKTAAPLFATIDVLVTPWAVLAVGLGVVGVRIGTRLASTMAMRQLLLLGWAGAFAWACALAALRGWGRVTEPFERHGEYLAAVGRVHAPGSFLAGFTDHLASYPLHVQGHPPGFVLVAWVLDRIGLGGPLPAALLCIAVGASAVPAVLLAARDVAGAAAARRAAPFLVLAPIWILVATSADAFFLGVGAWAVALVVLATGRRDRRGDGLALAGGLLFGVAAFLSYGLVLLALIPLTVAVARRRVRPIVLAAVGGLPVLLAFAAAGFWWPDGLAATSDRYFAGIASRRPYEVYVIADLAAIAVVMGPVVAPALARLRDRRLWLLVGGALGAIAVADLSGMAKAEVERIWLPFLPFVLLATAALGARAATVDGSRAVLRDPRVLLAVQVGWAIALESLVRTAW